MSNNGPKFKPVFFESIVCGGAPLPNWLSSEVQNPSDYAPEDEEWYHRPQDEVPVLDMEAYAEANYHFTLTAFEALLAKHGIAKLLQDMSKESADIIDTWAYRYTDE